LIYPNLFVLLSIRIENDRNGLVLSAHKTNIPQAALRSMMGRYTNRQATRLSMSAESKPGTSLKLVYDFQDYGPTTFLKVSYKVSDVKTGHILWGYLSLLRHESFIVSMPILWMNNTSPRHIHSVDLKTENKHANQCPRGRQRSTS